MKQKITITENRLREIIKEAVMSELSSDFVKGAYDNLDNRKLPGEEDRPLWMVDKIQRSNGRTSDRAEACRNLHKYMSDSGKKEDNKNPLAQEALRIWNKAGLENDIEWEESDWVSSGDETYGPCQGYTDYEGWKFYVSGNQEGSWDYEIDYSEAVEFETPDGESGHFWLM